MGVSIISKDYKDVRVTVHKEMPSNIITCKTYTIRQNSRQVVDRLTVMCLKYDLTCSNISYYVGEHVIICRMKEFNSINDFISYIKNKAGVKKYSFLIKGGFVLAKIEDKEYVYRIRPQV